MSNAALSLSPTGKATECMRCTRWLCNRHGMRRDNGRISLGDILYVAGRCPIIYMTLFPLYLMLSSLRDDYNIHVSLNIHQT